MPKDTVTNYAILGMLDSLFADIKQTGTGYGNESNMTAADISRQNAFRQIFKQAYRVDDKSKSMPFNINKMDFIIDNLTAYFAPNGSNTYSHSLTNPAISVRLRADGGGTMIFLWI